MIRRPTRSTRTDTLLPYTTLFRSEREGLRIAHVTDDLQRCFEIFVCFPGEADDEIARKRDVRAGLSDIIQHIEIGFYAVAAVHGFQNTIAACLHGQVKERHQLFDIAMRSEERRLGNKWVRTCRSRWC